MLLVQAGEVASWVGPTMAISLVVIALSFIAIAAAVVLTLRQVLQRMHQLSTVVDGLRGDLAPALKMVQSVSGEGERIAALVSGEQHPLLTVIAEHSVALLSVVRAMVEDIESSPGPPQPPPDEPPPPGPNRYQHIPVTVEE